MESPSKIIYRDERMAFTPLIVMGITLDYNLMNFIVFTNEFDYPVVLNLN